MNSFIVYSIFIKYDVEKSFDSSNYELSKLWEKPEVIGMTKDELDWKI